MTLKISFRGIAEAFGLLFAIAFFSLFAFLFGSVIWFEADSTWWWKVPSVLGGGVALIVVIAGFGWIYDRNPTLTIGGKTKKVKLPKARVIV